MQIVSGKLDVFATFVNSLNIVLNKTMCLHFLRSVYFAYFSKNKDEKKRQRHLSSLKCTHLQRNYEATTTIFTTHTEISGRKAQQPIEFLSSPAFSVSLFQQSFRILLVENEFRGFSESMRLASPPAELWCWWQNPE